jgi:hypothetical protein
MKHTKAEVINRAPSYRISNWSDYNKSLVNRGKLTFWINTEDLSYWYNQEIKQQGGNNFYSSELIEICLTVKNIYSLTYRSTEGFIASIIELLNLDLAVPDFSTLQRRSRKLNLRLKKVFQRDESINIVLDSTGLKVYGEGEWKVRKHGFSKYRLWKKLHIGMNPLTDEIEAVEVTNNSIHDCEKTEDLLEQIEGSIGEVIGDGSYDNEDSRDAIKNRGCKCIIPPQKNAKIKIHGNTKGITSTRDDDIRYIRKHGRKKWKTDNNYHRRSLIETTMFRFKNEFGDRVYSRLDETINTEVLVKVNILNKQLELGQCDSYKI